MPYQLTEQKEIRKEFEFLRLRNPNREKYISLSSNSIILDHVHKGIHLPSSYRLVRHKIKEDQFELAVLCDLSQSVVYYIKCNVWHDVHLGNYPVTQVLLWRSNDEIHIDATTGLARAVFKRYLLKLYGMIASDSMQTGQGQQFWEAQISSALRSGNYVYRYDRLTGDLTPIVSYDGVLDYSCDLWGDDKEKYEHVLALVSFHAL